MSENNFPDCERCEYDTCIEMLEQRGYNVIDKDVIIIAIKPNGEQMAVIFNNSEKFDTKGIKEVIHIMTEIEVEHVIIVYKNDVTSATKCIISNSGKKQIELFSRDDLKYNITKHCLQPQFERLSDQESVKFKQQYGTTFGTLRVDKPISRFYDYKRGDVIRITRKDGYINYRIVKG